MNARGGRPLALALVLAAPAAPGADFPCFIEPHLVVDVSTAVEGTLDSVEVDKGDIVELGQVVATLESRVEKAALERAEARVAMRAESRARQQRLERARRRFERAEQLSTEKFVSSDEVDELRSAVLQAELHVEADEEERGLARLDLARARAEYDQRFIRSPLTGVVVDRYLGPGEFAQAQPIVRIAQLDPLNVEVVLPAERFGRIGEGARGTVRYVASEPGAVQANVVVVERVIEAASGTFGARLELPNPGLRIPAGLECRVEFPG